jgi:ribosomal protein S18 acetylase RimI-like enzyme
MTAVRLRDQVAQDEVFLRDLFATTMEDALGLRAWPAREREALVAWQYEARRRDWREQWPDSSPLIVEADGHRAGRIWITGYAADGSRRVLDLAVAPQYRRRGVAGRALDLCEGPLHLNVARSNLLALRLYQRLGFVSCGGDQLDLFLHRQAG